MSRYPFVIRLTAVLFMLVLIIFSLIAARNFLYPVFFAILLAYLLYPMANFLEKNRFPRILANLVSIIFAIVVVAGAVFFVYSQVRIFVEDFPTLRRQALQNVDSLEMWIEETFGISSREQNIWVRERISEFFESGARFFGTAFTATTSTIAKVGLMPVYIFFLLYYRNKFKKFILQIVPAEKHLKTERILSEVSFVTERYMGGVFAVVLILCVLNSIGLMIVGLKYAILLGVISALFNFIPYFGTLIGGIVPLLYTLVISPHPEKTLGVIIFFIIIQFVENNILTPNITGGNVQLNPFVTILSIIVGGMIWGLPGMFLIVPFLAMFKIFCEYVDDMKPYAYLLGTSGTEKHALTAEKVMEWVRRKRVGDR